MKKNIIAIFLSLLIPFSLISCSKSSEVKNNEENNVSNSSSVNNNDTSSENKNTKKDIDPDTEKEENAKIYYYDVVSDKIVYINTTITVKDDNEVITLIDELKKSPNADISPSLSSEITLNSYVLNTEKSTITLDFSSNFVGSQNLGSGAESRTLTAISNTFGDYFNIENVVITLDGAPYSSGHILMNEGEAFKVNLGDTIELK
ncbi:GerMN domain-containing protein [Clostridium sp. AL.422]|uniref:GerMN domain-containing protein n=1 Tax=Clostridium TaxID=1485 RepID=UPI00293DB95B|nr:MULTISPECIES: GerMN domain-containing protein [unclassified Clostridium]MDV4151280.1 GerMN domain-containing protein [Clostridium sp. AL.422]